MIEKYEPRFKYIRDERQFNEDMFLKELRKVPFSLVYGVENPNEKFDIFNSPLLEAIDHHAQLKEIKVTRPPAPWMHDPESRLLKQACFKNRIKSRNTSDKKVLEALRKNRNTLK